MSWKKIANIDISTAKARGMVKEIDHPVCGPIKVINTPVKYSNADPSIRTPPPLLGEHTDEVLEGLGLNKDKIQTLKQNGVVA